MQFIKQTPVVKITSLLPERFIYLCIVWIFSIQDIGIHLSYSEVHLLDCEISPCKSTCMITTNFLKISTTIFTYNLVLWNMQPVRCIAIIEWQWFLLFKLTFRGGHYQHHHGPNKTLYLFCHLKFFVSMRGKAWENYTNRQKYLKSVLALHASTPLKALDIFLSILFFIPLFFSSAQATLINQSFPGLLLLWSKRKDQNESLFHLFKVSPSTFHKARLIRGRIKTNWMA